MIRVYQSGTRHGVRLPEAAMEQLRLAHRMRNASVEAELARDEEIRAILASDHRVADAETALAAAEAECEQIAASARRQHTADRTIATRPALAADLKAARARAKECRATLKAARAAARPILKPRLDQADADLKAALVRIRQEHAAQGLYWGIYNAIADDHRTAVKRIRADRKAGKPAQLRYRRWDGSGTLTVQLQRQAADPVRSPATVAAGDGKWRNVLRLGGINRDPVTVASLPRSQRRADARDHALYWSIGGGAAFELPITVHRPIPPEGDITGAQLTQRIVGGRPEITVAVTVRLPDPEPKTGPAVALHLGWRARGDGSVRVASWAADVPVTVPAGLAGLVTVEDGGMRGEVVIPAALLAYAAYPAVLRGIRDKEMAPVVERLGASLDVHPQPGVGDGPELTGAVVRRWRSPARFAALALRWRDEPPAGLADMAAELEAWRVHDRHLWTWESSQRVRATRRRDETYRRVAAWLASVAGTLVVDDADLRVLRRRPDAADSDPVLPGVVLDDARGRAAAAAPGRLRELARTAAAREGVRVVVVESAHLSRTCPRCGVVGDADPRYAAAAVVTCPACGAPYDQDRSAAALMLVRERSGGEPVLG